VSPFVLGPLLLSRFYPLGRIEGTVPADYTPEVLEALRLLAAAAPGFVEEREPDPAAGQFVQLLEDADPNGEFTEDNLYEQWGHWQYSGSWLEHCSSWTKLGNIKFASRFIAAAFKTRLVAQHYCYIHRRRPSGYLSDVYLQKIGKAITAAWHEVTKGVSAGVLVNISANVLSLEM
jgi:hypothetical protein